ncbi:hypothetical protein C2869_03470 [Saccharobesus litoralis]|uniref:Uncharacterized protein n=1 Tax=Saccharobesus litoralis TaxID=2172099 RepID=A0A2S0VMU8_9ALTE|nr:hypothetical protein [Saccharobesus litoralis]AWB65551.1 hypothetical protein C2869_03470 [Saccharobesus litoralis]
MKQFKLKQNLCRNLFLASLPMFMVACGGEDSKIIDLESPNNDGATTSPIVVSSIDDARLGSFNSFESFTVDGLAEGTEATIFVTQPFVYKIERNGQLITLRATNKPGVDDFQIFYQDGSNGDLDSLKLYTPRIPVGFTSFTSTVQNGDVVTVGAIASVEPSTSISGQAKVGLTEVPLSLVTTTADTVPNDFEFIGTEDSISAHLGEELEISFYVTGIDYATPISLVTDTTPKADDDTSSALGSARFAIGSGGIAGFEDRLLDSTIDNDEAAQSDLDVALTYFKAVAAQTAATDVETQVRKDFLDDGKDDETEIQAEIAARLPAAVAEAELAVETTLTEAFDKEKLGQLVKLTATAPLDYDQTATVTIDVGGVQKTWTITTDQDTTPEAIEFNQPETTKEQDESFETSAFEVVGINIPTPISITNGQYKITRDGVTGEYTADAGLVEEGDKITIKLAAGQVFDGSVTAVLDIGGVTQEVTVVTESQDLVPDDFSFDPKNAAPGTYGVSSTVITVMGINDATPITITGGEYQIGQADFTSQAGTVTAGDKVSIRAMAGATLGDKTNVTLDIGGVTADYVVTAALQLEGKVLFPPVNSFTEDDKITVRGSLTPPTGGVPTSVTVNGESATLDGNNWSVTLTDLQVGQNTLAIEAKDSLSGLWNSSVTVTRGAVTDAFPAGGESFVNMEDVAIDMDAQKYYVMSSTSANDAKVFEVDMATGARSLFVDVQVLQSDKGIDKGKKGTRSMGVAYSSLDKEVYVGNFKDDAVYQIPVAGDAAGRITSGSILSAHPAHSKVANGAQMHDPVEMDIDTERNLLIVATENGTQLTGVIAIDLASGDRSNFMPNKTPNNKALSVAVDVDGVAGDTGDRYFFVRKGSQTEVVMIDLANGNAESVFATGFGDAQSIDVNRSAGMLVVGDNGDNAIKLVSLADGSSITDLSATGSDKNALKQVAAIATEEGMGYAVVVDRNSNALVAVDLSTGDRVFISKNAN